MSLPVTKQIRQDWKRAKKLEPGLIPLWQEAKNYHKQRTPLFCANAIWYGYREPEHDGLKTRLCRIIGWDRDYTTPKMEEEDILFLRSKEAYDATYTMIYNALPDCRHEGRMCG